MITLSHDWLRVILTQDDDAEVNSFRSSHRFLGQKPPVRHRLLQFHKAKLIQLYQSGANPGADSLPEANFQRIIEEGKEVLREYHQYED